MLQCSGSVSNSSPLDAGRGKTSAKGSKRCDVFPDGAIAFAHGHRRPGVDAFESHRLFADIKDLLASDCRFDMMAPNDATEQPTLAAIDDHGDLAGSLRQLTNGGEC